MIPAYNSLLISILVIFACLLLIAATVGGTLLTYFYQGQSSLLLRLCLGAATGMALMATIGFLLSGLLGLTPASIALSAGFLLLPGLILLKPQYRQQYSDELRSGFQAVALRKRLLPILLYTGLILVLGLVFAQNMTQRPDGIYTGIESNLGDLPFHLQVISSFVYGHNIPVEDPTYAGVRFTYPILADFLTAMLVRSGAPVAAALWLQNMTLILAFVGMLHYWTRALTHDRVAAIFAPLLVIFSGGLGWWLLMQDLRESDGGLLTLLTHLPHRYTIMDNSIFRWGNSVTTLLMTQRSFLFGVALATCVLYLWWNSLESSIGNGSPDQNGSALSPIRPMLAAGICVGLLPLIHTHGFVILFGAAGCFALLFWLQRRLWSASLIAALLVGLPGVSWLSHGSAVHARNFIGWQIGWDHANNNPIWFWFVNTGLFIPLLLAAIFWRRYAVSKRAVWFYAPFSLCFIIPNLLKLSPWIWDNVKFLFYWYVASAPLVALVLARLWQQSSRRRWLAAGVLATLTLSGGLDILRVITQASQFQEFTPEGIQIANLINLLAPPRAVVLHAPGWNSPVYLTGRRSLLGYTAWLWSRGVETSGRESDINSMYFAGAAAQDLLARYQVDYVLLGPDEMTRGANAAVWASCVKLAQIGPYQLYKTDCGK